MNRLAILKEAEALLEQSHRNFIGIILRLDAADLEPAEALIEITETVDEMLEEMDKIVRSESVPI